MLLWQGQGPIQDLLDSLSAEELDSCGGPIRTNVKELGGYLGGPLATNADELGGPTGQYGASQATSSYPEGSLYERGKGTSTASSSRYSEPKCSQHHLFTELSCLHQSLRTVIQRPPTGQHLIMRLSNCQ